MGMKNYGKPKMPIRGRSDGKTLSAELSGAERGGMMLRTLNEKEKTCVLKIVKNSTQRGLSDKNKNRASAGAADLHG